MFYPIDEYTLGKSKSAFVITAETLDSVGTDSDWHATGVDEMHPGFGCHAFGTQKQEFPLYTQWLTD